MGYIVVVEWDYSCGDAYSNEKRTFITDSLPHNLEENFRNWIKSWIDERGWIDSNTTVTILHAYEIAAGAPQHILERGISRAIGMYSKEKEVKDAKDREEARLRQVEREKEELQRLLAKHGLPVTEEEQEKARLATLLNQYGGPQ